MSLTLITAPAVEPITLAEARAQCRIDGTEEDALLSIYIGDARSRAENETGRRLITQTWRQTLDEFPAVGDIRLEVPKPQSISQVQYLDANGVWQTLPPSEYVLDAATGPAGWLYPADGTSWPTTKALANAVRIDIVAGYGTAPSDVPDGIRHWMLLQIEYDYQQRGAIDSTGRATSIPGRYVDGKLDPHRIYGL